MTLEITAEVAFHLDEPGDALLQFEAAALLSQTIASSSVELSGCERQETVPAHGGIGRRTWISGSGRIDARYHAKTDIQHRDEDIGQLGQLPAHQVPGDAVEYLLDSRFCPVSRFQNFVDSEFAGTSGGARINAIFEWVGSHLEYVPGSSGPGSTALDSFVDRQGVCRDFAHVVIGMARASLIPARYVACYAPDVKPQDFHAVAEVLLADPASPGGHAWHLVDATGMSKPSETAIIGIGRDAADVSFLTTFGPATFLSSKVAVKRV